MLRKNYFLYLVFIALIAIQIPFLHADPDATLTYSRDAATDEGVYSSQVRNYINNGVFSLSNIDCILKAMLFSVLLFASMSAFGTSLLVARLMVLSLSFLILFLTCRNKNFRQTGLIFLLIAFTNYYIFQYAHFALSEMLSTLFIFSGIFFLFKNAEEVNPKRRIRNIFLSCLFIAFSYYSKVQFVYACVLAPAVLFFELLLIKGREKKGILSDFVYATIFTAMWGLVYYIVWYLPFKEIHQKLMAGQELTGVAFFDRSAIPVLKDNIKYIMFAGNNRLMSVLYIILFVIGIYKYIKTDNSKFKLLFVAANLWVLVESHKWFMTYLPSRYLVSLYVAEFFVIAIVLGELLNSRSRWQAFFSYACIFSFLIFNTYKYIETFNNREFVIQDANNYLAQYDLKNETAIGPWAGSFTWDCKMFSLPVWNHFLNYEEPLKTFQPRVVVCERDEADSGHAFKDGGIDLKQVSDSSRAFKVQNHWNVMVYWIRKDAY